MADLKLFPIGYVSTNNSTSKGARTDGGTAVTKMFEPNAGCNKVRMGFTAMSDMENRAIWTRKIGEYKHSITYTYNNIWHSEYVPIKRFTTEIAEHRANSFYVIDFSSGVKVTGFDDDGGSYNASIPDTTDFTATSGSGGNYACVWNPEDAEFRIGILSSIDDDASITFPDSTDYGNLNTFTEHTTFAYPVYRVYLLSDEEQFETGPAVSANEATTYAGYMRSGAVQFIQRDTK